MAGVWSVRGFGAVAPLVVGVLAAPAAAQTEARWLNAVSGSWFEPGLWDTGLVPNNTETTSYAAIIDAAGAAYEVTVDSDLRLDSLRIDSADATVAVERGGSIETGLIDVAAGRLALRGGAIRGSLIDLTGAGALDVEMAAGDGGASNFGVLDSVTIRDGDMRVASGGAIRIRGDLTLDGADVLLNESGGVSFDGSTTVRGGSLIGETSGWRMDLRDGADVRLASGTTIEGASGSIRLASSGRFVNAGLINASLRVEGLVNDDEGVFVNEGQFLFSAPGGLTVESRFENSGTVSISGDAEATLWNWSNSGLLEVGDSGELRLLGDWTNTGVIRQTGGTLRLGANLTTAQLRSVDRTGGVLHFSDGILDNTGETLVLDENLGHTRIGSVTIRGGVVENTDAPNIEIGVEGSFGAILGPVLQDLTWRGGLDLSTNPVTMTFDGAHFEQGDILLGPGSGIWLAAASFGEGVRVVNEGARLELLDGATLEGATVILRPDGFNGALDVRDGDASIGADSVVLAEGGDILTGGSFSGRLTNFGRIEATPGGLLRFGSAFGDAASPNFINAGEIFIHEGGTARLIGRGWRNDGVITAEGLLSIQNPVSSAQLAGIQQRGDGEVVIASTWDNTGQSFVLDSATGSYTFGETGFFTAARTLTGGEFIFQGGHRLIGGGGVLNGVTIRAGGDFVMDRANEAFGFAPGGLTLPDGDLVLAGSGAGLYLLPGEHRFDTFHIESRATPGGSERFIELLDGASLVVEGETFRGGGLNFRQQAGAGGVVNNGLIQSMIAGEAIRFSGATGQFDNAGTLRAADGAAIRVSTGVFNNGAAARIEGGAGSTLSLEAGQWTNAGVIEFGDAAAVILGGGSWENSGEIRVGANAVLTSNGVGVNTGVISMAGPGLLRMRGAFTTAFFESIDRAGSDVAVAGAWSNGAGEVSLAGPGDWRIESGSLQGGSFNLAGKTVTALNAAIRNTTLRDGVLALQAESGRLNLDLGAHLNNVTVRLDAGGAGVRLAALQTAIGFGIEMRSAPGALVQRVELGSGSAVEITGDGSMRGGNGLIIGSRSLGNRGVISADRAEQTLTVLLSGAAFTNNGLVEATKGGMFRLLLTPLTNAAGGTLTGGAWRVDGDGSSIDLGSITITRNAADIELRGAGARFDAIDALAQNTGRFALSAGHGFATIGDFASAGALEVSGGAFLQVAGALTLDEAADTAVTLDGIGAGRTGSVAMRANGIASLAGALHLALASGAEASVGDRWTILTASSVSGEFDDVMSSGLTGGRFFALEYGATTVDAVLVPSPSSIAPLGALGLVLRLRRRVQPSLSPASSSPGRSRCHLA